MSNGTIQKIIIVAIAGIFLIPLISLAQEAPTVTLSASPDTIEKGERATLEWHAENAIECKTSSGLIKSPVGFTQVQPVKTTEYFISCRNGVNQIAIAKVTVTVVETSGGSSASSSSSSNSSGSSSTSQNSSEGTSPNSSSSGHQFSIACIANPEVARIDQLVKFSATYTGNVVISRWFWTGDVSGKGQEVKTTFDSAGRKKADLFALTVEGYTAETSCYAFVEPDPKPAAAPASTAGSNSGAPGSSGTESKTNETVPPAEDAKENKDENLEAAAARGGTSGGLLFILLVSIILNIAILFYIFVFTKKKTRIENDMDYPQYNYQESPGQPEPPAQEPKQYPEAPEALFS